MTPAISVSDGSREAVEPVWFGMEIPSCAAGCGAAVDKDGETCRDCAAETETARELVARLIDAGVAVSREAVVA